MSVGGTTDPDGRRGLGLVAWAVVAAGCATTAPPSGAGLPAREQAILYELNRCGQRCKRKKPALQRTLERIRYQKAVKAGTVYALKRYLGRYPAGSFAAEVKRRLSALRFERARQLDTAWGWQWFVDHHGDSPRAASAQRALERALIRQLRRTPREDGLRDFLRRFPDSNLRHTALDTLAEIRFRQLSGSGDAVRMEVFLRLFPRSPRAAEVRRSLEALWRKRVALLGSWEALDAYVARYPNSQHRAALERQVARRVAAEATLDLDPDALLAVTRRAKGTPEARAAARLVKAIRANPAVADKLRALGRAARPYRPRVRLRALLAAAGGDDPYTARTALRSLAYFSAPRALQTLVHAVGAGHLGFSSAAWLSLREWFRKTEPGAARMAARELKSRFGPRTRNPSDALRVAALVRASGLDSRRVARWLGLARKERTHRLVALSVELSARRLGAGVRPAAALAFVEALEAKAKELAAGFPATLDRTNVSAGRMLAFQLAAVVELGKRTAAHVVRLGLMTPSVGRRQEEVLQRARIELGKFDRRLAQVWSEHRPAAANSVLSASRLHEKGRVQAFNRLQAQKGYLPRQVFQSFCARPEIIPVGVPARACRPRGSGRAARGGS